ncbi:MAG: potassium channel family protein [Gemmatimonadaceae bacterium]|jgi:nitrate reductase NapE component|nr:potassium channel family protein [Gemmatimonadaceae bacterium]
MIDRPELAVSSSGIVAIVVGALLVVATLVDAFEVMLLPRRVRRRLRLVRGWFRATWNTWTGIADVMPVRRRSAWLALYGPLSMIGLFAAWAVALIVGFGLVHWALASISPEPHSLLHQLYFSGVTFFTLGYGDVTAPTGIGKIVSVLEAGIGFGLIAVVIGYLPVLYQLFSRREAHVIRLDARAGSPPTAGELLARHAVSAQGLTALGALLADWEQWSSELLESHLSYPMLGYYRSQHDNESWLAALTTILDACALVTIGLRVQDPAASGGGERSGRDALTAAIPLFQARITFATARLTMIEMARALHVPVQASTDDGAPPRGDDCDDRLPPAVRSRLVAQLRSVHLVPESDAADAWRALAALRRSYEPHASALAMRLRLPLPDWTPPRDAHDNWAEHAGGADARRIVEGAERDELAGVRADGAR